jgi:hypothetical protein|tara:strand:- start:63 stop:554 length:492 start_codon:yes stop_codon:yes gene_type:complete
MKRIKVSFEIWIQLLGMLGVLGGLIFVGLEMQQSQRIAIAGQIQARNQMLLDNQLAFLGEEPIGRSILSQGNPITFNPESLSEEEFAVWYQIMQTRAITIQNAFQQYQLDLLPDDVWEQATERILSHWTNCHIRPIWYTSAVPSFQRYLDALPAECVSTFLED